MAITHFVSIFIVLLAICGRMLTQYASGAALVTFEGLGKMFVYFFVGVYYHKCISCIPKITRAFGSGHFIGFYIALFCIVDFNASNSRTRDIFLTSNAFDDKRNINAAEQLNKSVCRNKVLVSRVLLRWRCKKMQFFVRISLEKMVVYDNVICCPAARCLRQFVIMQYFVVPRVA